MKPRVISLLLPFALAACGAPDGNAGGAANKAAANTAAAATNVDGGGNQASAEAGPAPALAGAGQLQAGQWELTATVRSFETPGMAPAQQAAMRRRIGQPMVQRACLTEQDTRDFVRFATRASSPGCAMGDRVYAGGVLRVSMSCPMPGGRPGTVRMNTEGRYTPTSLELAMRQEMPGPGPGGGTARMSATIAGRRIGPCPPGGARPARPQLGPPSGGPPVAIPAPPSAR